GREFFLAHDVEAVPAFILALQMAARRLTGKIVRITQFVSLSRYRCMDLATPVVTTPEVIRFVEAMDSEAMAADRAMTLLHEAIHSQKEVCRKARHALPFDDLLALFLRSRKGVQKWYVLLVAALAVKILRLLGCYRPLPREVLVSHPEIYPTVPVFGRPGVRLPYVKYFGLHYQIMDEKIVITVMPAVGWTIPNAELVAEVRESLQRIQNLIVHAGRKS
ncbi:MAG: choline/carnitine O-acyltransferase, partial [candidate division KSB1 bacterium]|nr:choline/carnitine O-acyltransferase [candidate division KSB1 bacterium]